MKKIIIKRKGKDFLLNGKRTQLRMRTSFKLLGYLYNNNKAKARRWLERCKEQGFHGVRFFGEYHWWVWEKENVFWGLPPRLAPYSFYEVAPSKWKLRLKHQKAIRDLVDLLVELEMVGEYSVLATLKSHQPDWGDPRKLKDVVPYNSHALRVTAEFLQEINATNLIYELYNEIDNDAVRVSAGELQAQLTRWKMRDLRGSLVGVSNADPWNPKPVTGPSMYCIHTSRNKQWWDVSESVAKIRKQVGARIIYLNENKPYGTQAQIDNWNWKGITAEWIKIQKQWNSAYAAKVGGYCFHDLTGMLTDPNAPISHAESAHQEQFGGGEPSPPPPPPLEWVTVYEKDGVRLQRIGQGGG